MEVLPENINDIQVNTERTSQSSVYINNFIHDSLGNVKIYKAKKRMELRLYAKQWFDNGDFISFQVSLDDTPIDLRSYVVE